jgi:hypothetical protein
MQLKRVLIVFAIVEFIVMVATVVAYVGQK